MAGERQSLSKSLGQNTFDSVTNSRILVVGAGGIGCELLKNLVLTGFENLEVIDLDTIDVSNLNRQFLFHKKHVGKSKSQVAKESALSFNPNAKITAYHDSIMSSDYGIDFFKQFTLVMNALDNRAARNHVNRMCLAADVPLLESGTAGYLGQVTVIKKGVTECYECQPKPTQKSFPGCTIRNTPSEPVHCIVWAKHLFNQLFGEADADEEVSPDTEDPEATADAGENFVNKTTNNGVSDIQRKSTRLWAQDTDYDVVKLFTKLFHDDIKYLLSMDKLWKTRRPPIPLSWDQVYSECDTNLSSTSSGLKDQRVWSVGECAQVFQSSVGVLKNLLQQKGEDLIWDKDHPESLDFVTSTANLRAHIFGIPMNSRFDIKSMAGNIIPAIATTNAVIAGLLLMEGLKVLTGNLDKCKTIYLNRQPNLRKKLFVPCSLEPPDPVCYVCSSKPEVTVILNTQTLTIKTLNDKILKERFGMVAPDVEIDDGKGTIIISSEEGETEENNPKGLSAFNIKSGTRLKADDFLQNYQLVLNIRHIDKLGENMEFEVEGEIPVPMAADEPSTSAEAQPEEKTASAVEEIVIVENLSRKRKTSDDWMSETRDEISATKKAKVSLPCNGDDDDIVML